MKPFTPKKKHGPEYFIQKDIISYLRTREWLVKPTHGSMFQSGFPDLFATHKRYGMRWVEVKNLKNYRFTPAQLEWFPQIVAHGTGIWILTAATDAEYDKLFKDCNWWQFLKL